MNFNQSKSDKNVVIWTFNIDKKKSRKQGRKIPRKKSVPNVKLSEMVEACKRIGIKCTPEKKKYPRFWWEEGGRVLIPKVTKKSELMLSIAEKIAEMRGD